MKIAFYLFITLCLFSACAKKGNPLTPPSNSLVGEWQWVDAYMYRDMYVTPKSTYNKGIITFTADGKYIKVKPDGTTENGTYTLAKAKPAVAGLQGPDSILYNQINPNVMRPVYEVLNATFDFFTFSGDTLQIGGINRPNATNYGLTNEYVRCTIHPTPLPLPTTAH